MNSGNSPGKDTDSIDNGEVSASTSARSADFPSTRCLRVSFGLVSSPSLFCISWQAAHCTFVAVWSTISLHMHIWFHTVTRLTINRSCTACSLVASPSGVKKTKGWKFKQYCRKCCLESSKQITSDQRYIILWGNSTCSLDAVVNTMLQKAHCVKSMQHKA